MRRLIITSLLTLFLISGTGYSYADHHRGGHDKDHKEHRYERKGHDKKRDKDRDKWRKEQEKKWKKDQKKWKKEQEKRWKKHGRPNMGRPLPPPPPPAYRPRHYNHAYHYPHYSVHDNLGYMISRIARGGRDVNVWQVDEGTYVVRFRKGNRMYAQYLYPYEGRYGKRSTITVDWSPLSPWTLIPGIHLNINL